jgi:flagellar hook-associated protein 2
MIRFGGLATGQDTESIVNSLLEVERIPIIRLENEIVDEEEKYAAWSDLDTKVSDLNTKINKLTSYLTWRQNDVSSTKESVVTGSASNEAALTSYAVNVTAMAQSHMVGSDAQADTTSDLNLSGTFQINGSDAITVSATDSLEEIRDLINAATNMTDNVTASIINTTLVLSRDTTGDTEITMDDDSSGILSGLGVWNGSDWKNTLQDDQNLAATVNGVTVSSISNNGITSVLTGVTLNFKGEGSSTLDISRDTETIKSAFEEFVDAYNSVMELAEEQTEVSLSGSGNTIDNVGVLQGESAVSSLRYRSRALATANFVDPLISNGFNNLQDIGIWTEGNDNRLTIFSSSRLDDALENNFDDVEDFIRDFDEGIMQKLSDYVDEIQSPVDGTIARRQTSIRNRINDKEDRIDAIDLLIIDKETQLYEHYSRMESAVASIRSQGQFVSGSL